MATVRPYAEIQRLRARYHYWAHKPLEASPEDADRLMLFETNLIADIPISNPNDARYGQTVSTPMYRAGTLAAMLGKSTQTIRQYEKSGLLPPAMFHLVGKGVGSERRGYTADQLKVVLELMPLRSFSDLRGVEYSPFARELWRRWGEMPDGVVVEPRKEDQPVEPFLGDPRSLEDVRKVKRNPKARRRRVNVAPE